MSSLISNLHYWWKSCAETARIVNRYSYNPLTFQSTLLWVENLKVKYLQTNLELDEAIAGGISVTVARCEVTFYWKLMRLCLLEANKLELTSAASNYIKSSREKFHEIELNQNLGKTKYCFKSSRKLKCKLKTSNCPKLKVFRVEGFLGNFSKFK